MTKILQLNTVLSDGSAPLLVTTPGVGGYSDRYAAAAEAGAPGAVVGGWGPLDVGGTLNPLYGVAPGVQIEVREDAGRRHLRSTGGAGRSRVIGPNKTTLPFTLAAVVRASGNTVTGVVGANGFSAGRSGTGTWYADGGGYLTTTEATADWAIIILQVTATQKLLRVNGQEWSSSGTFASTSSYSGIYFGPSTATPADIRELVYWPAALTTEQRNAVASDMRVRHNIL